MMCIYNINKKTSYVYIRVLKAMQIFEEHTRAIRKSEVKQSVTPTVLKDKFLL